MKKNILVLTVFISLLFQSCGLLSDAVLWLDNPTDETISVIINGDEHEIAPGELKRVDGFTGKQKFTGSDGVEVEIDIESSSLINCTKSTYIISSVEYTSNSAIESTLPDPVIVEVGGVKYSGNFEVYTDVVVPHGDINYNVLTPEPEEISISKSIVVQKKMYRIKDFLADSEMDYYKM